MSDVVYVRTPKGNDLYEIIKLFLKRNGKVRQSKDIDSAKVHRLAKRFERKWQQDVWTVIELAFGKETRER